MHIVKIKYFHSIHAARSQGSRQKEILDFQQSFYIYSGVAFAEIRIWYVKISRQHHIVSDREKKETMLTTLPAKNGKSHTSDKALTTALSTLIKS